MECPIYKQSRAARIVFYVVFTLVLTVFLPVSGGAQTAPSANATYTVEGVEVDITDKNAVVARERALDEAQAKAYKMLAERILPPEQAASIKVPDPVTLSTLVQDFEVVKEQASRVRYKGTYTVRFRPTTFKNKLESQGLTVEDEARGAVLVLPILMTGAQTDSTIWGDQNPWMSAWRALPQDAQSALAPLALPLGDAQDMQDVSDGQGLALDPMAVQRMAARYGAQDVALVVLTGVQTGDAGNTATIDLYKNGFEGPQFVRKISVPVAAGEDASAIYARAVERVQAVLRGNWKSDAAYQPAMQAQNPMAPNAVAAANSVYPVEGGGYKAASPVAANPPVAYTRPALGAVQSYPAVARFASVQEWVRMKNTLDRLYGMQAVMIKGLKTREASVDLRFAGDGRALQLALQNAGLSLRGGANGVYEITMPSTIYAR